MGPRSFAGAQHPQTFQASHFRPIHLCLSVCNTVVVHMCGQRVPCALYVYLCMCVCLWVSVHTYLEVNLQLQI